jgi:acyl-coenzyme A thioesterase PaaI-like protein
MQEDGPSVGGDSDPGSACVPQRYPVAPHDRCFGCNPESADRVVQRFEWCPISSQVLGTAYFGPQAQGPPQHAHGGSLATVLDEAMGLAAFMGGQPCLSVQLNVSYRHAVPLGAWLRVVAKVDHRDGRKLSCRATLARDDGTVMAEAVGLFVLVLSPRAEAVAAMSVADRAQTWSRRRSPHD